MLRIEWCLKATNDGLVPNLSTRMVKLKEKKQIRESYILTHMLKKVTVHVGEQGM